MKLPENFSARIWFPWDAWQLIPAIEWSWGTFAGQVGVTWLFLEFELTFLDHAAFLEEQKNMKSNLFKLFESAGIIEEETEELEDENKEDKTS